MSIDRSDDDAPTELDVDLTSSSSEEAATTISGAKPSIRDTLPADSEPRTLEPQLQVMGLGSSPLMMAAPPVVDRAAVKAYAAEVRGASHVDDGEEEETVTDRRSAVDRSALLEPRSDSRSGSRALPVLGAEEGEGSDGKGGTVKIVRTPAAVPVAPPSHAVTLPLTPPPQLAAPRAPEMLTRRAPELVVPPPPPFAVAAPVPAPMETARRPRARKSKAGCAVFFVLVVAAAAVGVGAFFMKYGLPSFLAPHLPMAPLAAAPSAASPSATAREPLAAASSAPASVPASGPGPAPSAATASDSRDVATTGSGPSDRPRGRPPKGGSRPSGRSATPPPTSSGPRGAAPLHI